MSGSEDSQISEIN